LSSPLLHFGDNYKITSRLFEVTAQTTDLSDAASFCGGG
jgi:hypothetical protein